MWSHMEVIWSNAIVLGITPTTIKTDFFVCILLAITPPLVKRFSKTTCGMERFFCPLQYTSENKIRFGVLFEKKVNFHFRFWRLLLDLGNSDLVTLIGYSFVRNNFEIKNKMTVGKQISRAL